jgi:hypothetical protein
MGSAEVCVRTEAFRRFFCDWAPRSCYQMSYAHSTFRDFAALRNINQCITTLAMEVSGFLCGFSRVCGHRSPLPICGAEIGPDVARVVTWRTALGWGLSYPFPKLVTCRCDLNNFRFWFGVSLG